MANNYIAKIRAELDSGSLQEQINKIVKNSGTIKIKVEADGDISGFIKDISKKVESAGNVSIKPKVDVSEIDSSMGTLSKTITRIVKDGTQSVESIFKSVGSGFDRTISQIDGEAKKITQDYESYAKRISTLSEQISNELRKASETMSKIPSGYSGLSSLKEKFESVQAAPNTEENLQDAKRLTQEIQEQLQYSTKLLELERKQREEREKAAKEEANAINKNAREEFAIREKINEQLKEARTRMEAVKMSSSQRLEIEKKIEDAMAMENSEDRLNALKRIKEEIAAMGKNAMSLGAMLQTAYEKFANKLRLCTEMCIEKQCVYAGKS